MQIYTLISITKYLHLLMFVNKMVCNNFYF